MTARGIKIIDGQNKINECVESKRFFSIDPSINEKKISLFDKNNGRIRQYSADKHIKSEEKFKNSKYVF